MAYRFSLNGITAECDTVQEFLALTANKAVTPTTKKQRARKVTRKYTPRGLNRARKASGLSWARAKAWAAKHDMTVPGARAFLSRNPDKLAAADALIARTKFARLARTK